MEVVYKLNISSKPAEETVTFPSTINLHEDSIHLYIYSKEGVFLDVVDNIRTFSTITNTAQEGDINKLELNPEKDLVSLGYDVTDTNLVYYFFKLVNLENYEVVEISTIDPTEVLLKVDNPLEIYKRIVNELKSAEYYIRVNGTTLYTLNNIGEYEGYLALKLNEEVEELIESISSFEIYKGVSKPVEYSVDVKEEVESTEKRNYIKGPNFDIVGSNANSLPTSQEQYETLPIDPLYAKLKSSENSVELSIDYSKPSNFIHYSSQVERLLGYMYKLELLEAADTAINLTNGLESGSVSGSILHFTSQKQNVYTSFDHYENYLYYEKSDLSWPKDTSTGLNLAISSSIAQTWATGSLGTAKSYDSQNVDLISNTIPEFIREDITNDAYVLFVKMIGHHFDNVWVYIKDITNKYDLDNRLNFGVSKDVVKRTLLDMGINLPGTSVDVDSLEALHIGVGYITGSANKTTISTVETGSLVGDKTSYRDYEIEKYKRLYHNIPILLKTKGTVRGLETFLNSMGIPNTLLNTYRTLIKEVDRTSNIGVLSSSLNRTGSIHVETSGSIVDTLLSSNTSIRKSQEDLITTAPLIEVGFSQTNDINNFIRTQLTGSFNIDDYIGTPGTGSSFQGLLDLRESILQGVSKQDIKEYTSIVNYYDNSIFQLVDNFIPSKTPVLKGLIVKQDILNRNRVLDVKPSTSRSNHTGSIEIGNITGGDSGAYRQSRGSHSTYHVESIITPLGYVSKVHNSGTSKFTGKYKSKSLCVLQPSLNSPNPFKKYNHNVLKYTVNFTQFFDCRLDLIVYEVV
jgi:hypothetical protein